MVHAFSRAICRCEVHNDYLEPRIPLAAAVFQLQTISGSSCDQSGIAIRMVDRVSMFLTEGHENRDASE